ncbi:maleylpyruvate isomerase family mycothiol-dependent enzyme [Amycolatopsis cynarae]|uniref:Maleylpyruvate isomerase family mycothiol-dependent enzyme n=1 Tax=Amycolatopsis cynarae TaxID=2995223 RepID=A0ABY7B5Z3_9PSEU|nr:maleylpyruvate isomerase family mycothiol-dependent enzyme [Amycolatopsis sp. HUAS 11-8]WAL67370.1 maleylpyruvate isomerase family mycothiol-dependent enzyme [Amycolatopsis sp. HUAS 11-8]
MAGKALIEHGRFLEVLGIEVELLAEAARAAPVDTPVPACPGFTIGEVARHVGGVYRVARRWLTDGEAPREWPRNPAPGQSIEDYLRTGLAELLGELSGHDPREGAAGWWPQDQTYGFWMRRLAHETTVHRYDVQEAAGTPVTPIAEDLATDGVDEALAVWFGGRLPMLGLSGTTGRSVAVQVAGHQWIARAGPGETEARRCSAEEAAQADGLVSGSPMPVYLWLWGRQGHQSVTWDGDEDAIGQFWALLRLATR